MQFVLTQDIVLQVMQDHLMTPVSGNANAMGMWRCACGSEMFVEVGQFSYFPLTCRLHLSREIVSVFDKFGIPALYVQTKENEAVAGEFPNNCARRENER